MCFSKTKMPNIPKEELPEPAPTPSPVPSPIPTETESQVTADKRRKKTEAVKYGLLSTIKTSPRGIMGNGVDLSSGTGKKTLGS